MVYYKKTMKEYEQGMIKRDINAIIILLATQSMINLGEIQDPVTRKNQKDLEKAKVFIDLLEVLEEKTQGNLTVEETNFFKNILKNLKMVYEKKNRSGN